MPREVAFKDLTERKSLSLVRFSDRYQAEWDKFVWKSNNGTLFHTRRFLNYHPKERFTDASLIFLDESRWLGILPFVERREQGERVWISHPGASMGGLVCPSSLSFKYTFSVVEALLLRAHAEGVGKIYITLPPQVYFARPCNYFDFALLENGFTYLKREVSSVVPLDFDRENTLQVFSPESRRAVRRAQKLGVQVRESEDFAAFYAILQANLNMRHNVQPTHSLDELLLLKRTFPDKVRLFAAFAGTEMVAGLVFFACNDRVVLAFYISHREDKQKYRGVNLLFHDSFRWAIQEGFKFLDFGIFTVWMKPNWGLARFKESFGALGIFRDTLVKSV